MTNMTPAACWNGNAMTNFIYVLKTECVHAAMTCSAVHMQQAQLITLLLRGHGHTLVGQQQLHLHVHSRCP